MERGINPLAAESSRLNEDGVLDTGLEDYEGASTDLLSLQLPQSSDVLDGHRRKYLNLPPFLSLIETRPDKQKSGKIMATMKHCEDLPIPPGHPYIEAHLRCGASDWKDSTKVYVSKSLGNTAATQRRRNAPNRVRLGQAC
ncbi:hypothetical protein AC579_708 [Pseudocercospora musae]|uniref:Uncharacterized protein n=1 Tax=Pseudocercospora musae TaxID=113226 RepID=A0A139GZC7_9PEZI|nr:hypothetical protein AC579_708 [Pseudocercospora musae]